MSRRGNKEGSIYQRTDGRWVSTIDLGYRDGRRHRKSFYGETRKEVQNELTRALRAEQLGLPPESGRLTVRDWLTRWLAAQRPPALKPKTYAAYEYQTRVHLIPAFGRSLLAKLQPQDVRELMRSKTIRHLRATLRAALNVAVHDGLIQRNVAALAKPPRLEKKPLHVFDQDEAIRFLSAVKGHRLEALFTVGLSLGLREGEILGLRWEEDVDLEAGSVTVNYTQQRVKNLGPEGGSSLMMLEPKTEKSRRRIRLPQVAVSALAAHRMAQDQERLAAGSGWVETGMVFTTRRGTLLDQRSMLRKFYPILKAAALPRIRFHDLRHSAATLLLAQGVHPRLIMELFGHSSISLTMNTYGHVLEDMKHETARKMDEALNPVAVKLAVNSATAKAN